MTQQSPSQTVGPFFHYGLFFGGENILVNEQTRGERIYIHGQVLDGDDVPLPDAMVEIWQADAKGYFHHPNDPQQGKADPHFKGFGRADTWNESLAYSFKTVKPGLSAGQIVPYINVRVFARGMLIHAVTRLYFSDEAHNYDDPVLQLVPAARRPTLIAQRIESGDLPTYRFDIRLQGEGETVFFDV